jgi:hypothetical protein
MRQLVREHGNGFHGSSRGEAVRTAPDSTDEQFVEFDVALASDSVTLDQIIEAQYHLTSAKDPSAQQPNNTERRSYGHYLPRLWASYERRNAGWIHKLFRKGMHCKRGKILEC